MEDWKFVAWHCLRAALGDGLLVVLVFAAAAAAQGSTEWFRDPRLPGIAAMVVAGLAIGVIVEWWGLIWEKRWEYSALMPRFPGTEIGVLPVVQMLVLPPGVFWILSRWR
jgi:hypothetical protein